MAAMGGITTITSLAAMASAGGAAAVLALVSELRRRTLPQAEAELPAVSAAPQRRRSRRRNSPSDNSSSGGGSGVTMMLRLVVLVVLLSAIGAAVFSVSTLHADGTLRVGGIEVDMSRITAPLVELSRTVMTPAPPSDNDVRHDGAAADDDDVGATTAGTTPGSPSVFGTYSACEGGETSPASLVGAYGFLGGWRRKIVTADAHGGEDDLAELLFNQGLALFYGFNQEEAARNFKACIASDANETAAMCYWGLAYSIGPIINKSNITETEHAEGRAALETAMLIAEKNLASLNDASQESSSDSDHEKAVKMASVEVEMIAAALVRFPVEAVSNYLPVWHQYSDAMQSLARAHPMDYDIQALFAESLMILSPWRYRYPSSDASDSDGSEIDSDSGSGSGSGGLTMTEAALEAYRVLETVILTTPSRSERQHLLALHLMVHLTESDTPSPSMSRFGAARGEEAADRLWRSSPGACHLTHMAAHTMVRIGRYDDAVRIGLDAMECDAMYVSKCLAAYVPGHNVGLMQLPAMMSGQSRLALDNALPLAALPPLSGFTHVLYPFPDVFVKLRFGMFDELKSDLTELKNASGDDPFLENDDYSLLIYHYALGIAEASSASASAAGDLGAARYHLSMLLHHLDAIEYEDTEAVVPGAGHVSHPIFSAASPFWPARKPLGEIMSLLLSAAVSIGGANNILAGGAASNATDSLIEDALTSLKSAAEVQDSLPYMEPEYFYLPVKPCVGDMLLDLGRVDDALAYYKRDTMDHPGSEWAAFGISRAERAQLEVDSSSPGEGVATAGEIVRASFVSKGADFTMSRSCNEMPVLSADVRSAADAARRHRRTTR